MKSITTTTINNDSNTTAILHLKKTGHREFKAGVKFQGNWVTAEGGQRKSAISNLEDKLLNLGASIPNWSVNEHQVQQEAISAPDPIQAHMDSDHDSLMNLYDEMNIDCENPSMEEVVNEPTSESEEPLILIPVQVNNFQAIMNTAPKADKGYITPVSDKQAWAKVYRKAIEFVSSTKQDNLDEKPSEANQRFRAEVDTLMESIGYIGAFRMTPGGDRWIRLSGELDPTVRQFNRGEGSKRDNFHRNINGNFDEVQSGKSTSLVTGKKQSPKRPYNRKSSTKKTTKKEGTAYTYTHGSAEQRKAAYVFAKGLSTESKERGDSADVQRLNYKYGYCVSLAEQGLPQHDKFIADLKDAGFDTAELTEGALKVG